ncbi:DapH/DapD/GlmU-related protein [Cryobacterium sp. 10C3]|nr:MULTISPECIES: DapH/DapD/GlmU-related protein [unclassified Cryobacterium]MDY7557692.1 DapH/DapD/GlmU-related protein [Cryobacterium sp. 10C3]
MAVESVVKVPKNRSRIPAPLEGIVRTLQRRLMIHGLVTYGKNLRMGSDSTLSSVHGLRVGHNVSIGQRTVIEVDGAIGDYCLIGRGVQIVGRVDHSIDEVGIPMAFSTWVGDRPAVPQDAVQIGSDVWIGGGVIILGGVTIGEGAVLGAGAVVTHDIEPYGIAVGNPARVIRKRFDSDAQRHVHSTALRVDSSDVSDKG